MRHALAALLLLASTLSPSPSPDRAAERLITAAQLRGHVRFLASDLLEGRGPGTRGDALAQAYLASQFEALGLEGGAADGGYLQPVKLLGLTASPDVMSLQRGPERLGLQYKTDFIAVSGREVAKTEIKDAELVFVGYGITAPEFGWDDFKTAALKDKVLVVMNNDPESDPALFAGKTRLYYGRWDYKFERAAKTGALGAIIIHTTPSAGYPWHVVSSSWSGPQFELPDPGAAKLAVKAWWTEPAARRVFKLAGQDLDALMRSAQSRDFKPVPLGVTVSVAFPNAIQHVETANVLGRLPGADAKLAKQVVLYTAHHDHLGIKPSSQAGSQPGADVIYNGAVDNASGVAQLLAVARAYAALDKRPARSILFAAVGGEEQGLLGSTFLAAHPPVPLADITANINMDGANIFGRTRDVSVIGLGKTTLDRALAPLARAQGRVLKPDPQPDRGAFYRSDQFSFAKQGVPCAYFESGLDYRGRPAGWGKEQREAYEAQHYHQPSDELTDTWNLEGAVEDAKLYFELGLTVARTLQAPEWTPGDEFEVARKASQRSR